MLISQTPKKRRKATETSFRANNFKVLFSEFSRNWKNIGVKSSGSHSLPPVRDTRRDPLTIETKTYRLLPPKLVLSIQQTVYLTYLYNLKKKGEKE